MTAIEAHPEPATQLFDPINQYAVDHQVVDPTMILRAWLSADSTSGDEQKLWQAEIPRLMRGFEKRYGTIARLKAEPGVGLVMLTDKHVLATVFHAQAVTPADEGWLTVLWKCDQLSNDVSEMLDGTARDGLLNTLFDVASTALSQLAAAVSAREARGTEPPGAGVDGDTAANHAQPSTQASLDPLTAVVTAGAPHQGDPEHPRHSPAPVGGGTTGEPGAPQAILDAIAEVLHIRGGEAAGYAAPPREDQPQPPVLKNLNDELDFAQQHYERALRKSAQMRYFLGTLIGLAVLAVACGALAVSFESRHVAQQAGAAILLSIGFGGLGATVSVLTRLSSGSLTPDSELGLGRVLLLGSIRPAIGALFGIFLFLLIKSSFLPIAGPADASKELHFFASVRWVSSPVSASGWRRTCSPRARTGS